MYFATVICLIDAKLEQFAVDPRCSPRGIGDAHLVNELANVRSFPWPAAVGSRFPTPIGPKTRAMPTDDRLRLEDFERVQHFGGQPIEPGKHQAIDVAEGHSLGRSTAQRVELVSQSENFGLQR
jgi:hypothetical protein